MVKETSIEPTKACVLDVVIRKKPASISVLPLHAETKRSGRLEEAVGLALAINLDVVHQQLINLNRPSPSTLIGKGNVDELKGIIAFQNISLVVVNTVITPIQQRNLEKVWKCKVIDRNGLILEIFGARARTAEGKVQVELAALKHQRSRLVRSWTHLERQRGGFGFIGGPGESQLELDRRLIDERILKLQKQLDQVKRTRGLHRQSRKRSALPIVALVGYTNAGKSTLFNSLAKADVFAKDLLFATLDPAMRRVKLSSGREIILSDTVGFISELPTQLIAAFRATLEEVCAADVIIHVRDCAHVDSEHQVQDVYKVLGDLGLMEDGHNPSMIEVYNKVDLLDDEQQQVLSNRLERTHSRVALSALSGEGTDKLLKLIDKFLNRDKKVVDITLSSSDGDLLAWCYRRGTVIKRNDKDDEIQLTLWLSPEDSKDMLEKINKTSLS